MRWHRRRVWRAVELHGVRLEGVDAGREDNAVLGRPRENMAAVCGRAIKPIRIVERPAEQAPNVRKPLEVEVDLGRAYLAEMHRHLLVTAVRVVNESLRD